MEPNYRKKINMCIATLLNIADWIDAEATSSEKRHIESLGAGYRVIDKRLRDGAIAIIQLLNDHESLADKHWYMSEENKNMLETWKKIFGEELDHECLTDEEIEKLHAAVEGTAKEIKKKWEEEDDLLD